MVTNRHETSHRLFQERPEILTPVFKVLGLPIPEKAAVDVLTPDVSEIRPLERRVDSVLRVEPSDGDTFLLAIEAQQRKDRHKGASWAYYVAFLQAKYNLPVLLLVVCQERATAKWATGPFRCGARGWTSLSVQPLVVGPDNIPLITDQRAVAENLAMTAFSALTHVHNPDAPAILEALARVLEAADRKSARYYHDFLDIGLGDTPAGEKWRELMTFVTYFPGRGTVRETAYLEGKAEGKAEGEAKAILRVLERNGVPVPDDVRERITGCTDLEVLDRWLDRSFDATDVNDLFTELPTAH